MEKGKHPPHHLATLCMMPGLTKKCLPGFLLPYHRRVDLHGRCAGGRVLYALPCSVSSACLQSIAKSSVHAPPSHLCSIILYLYQKYISLYKNASAFVYFSAFGRIFVCVSFGV